LQGGKENIVLKPTNETNAKLESDRKGEGENGCLKNRKPLAAWGNLERSGAAWRGKKNSLGKKDKDPSRGGKT